MGNQLSKKYSKTNEITYWAPLPLGFNFGIKRVSLAGKMNKVSLIKPGNLKLFPYALTQLTNFSQKKEQTSNFDVGADLKYSITPSLTLDLHIIQTLLKQRLINNRLILIDLIYFILRKEHFS